MNKHKNRFRSIAIGLVALGCIGLAASAWLLIDNEARTTTTTTTVPGSSATENIATTRPPEDQVKQHTVAADAPKFIDIPAIGLVQARVMGLGQKANGEIVAPRNIHDAGWFTDSAKPSQAGATFIYGHLSSWTAHGAFYDLKKLRVNDTVTITRGDDKTYKYVVKKVETKPVGDINMETVLDPVLAGQPGLNLMTCAGKVIKGTGDFTHRLVVYAALSD